MRPRLLLACGCLALVLVILVPFAVLGAALLRSPGSLAGARRGFDQGFSRQYLGQRQAAAATLRADVAAVGSCEAAGGQPPCLAPTDTLGFAAADESQSIARESGLFFFPACLRGSAAAETAALTGLHDTAVGMRTIEPQAALAIRALLADLAAGLSRVQAAIESGLKCEGP